MSKFLDIKNQATAVHGVNYIRMVGKTFNTSGEIRSRPEVCSITKVLLKIS